MNALLTGMDNEVIQAVAGTLKEQDQSVGTCPTALPSPSHSVSDLDKAAPTRSSEG